MINSSPKIALFTSASSSFLSTFLASAVTVSLPAMGATFHLNHVEVGWIISSFLLAAAVAVVPIGKLSDIYGLKIFYSAGMWTIAISSLLCGFAHQSWLLILGRVGQGLGVAAISSTSIAIISQTFSPEKRGKYLGISISFTYIGLTTGPFIGGILTEHLGWRALFYIVAPLSVLISILIHLGISRQKGNNENAKLDIRASVLFGTGLILLLYGLSDVQSLFSVFLLLTSFICFFLFVKRELTSSNPILGVTLLRHNGFAYSNLAALINYCATFAVAYTITLYLQIIKGFSPQQAGLIMICQPAMMAILTPFTGRLSDYRQPRFIASTGMFLCGIALFILSFLTIHSPTIHVITGLVVLGIGCALFSAPNTSAVMRSVEKENYGTASAFVATMRIIGQMLSMATAMLILSIFAAKTAIPVSGDQQFIKGLQLFFVVAAILCGAGIFVSFARGDIEK